MRYLILLVVLLQGCGGSSSTQDINTNPNWEQEQERERSPRRSVEVVWEEPPEGDDQAMVAFLDTAWRETQVCLGMGASEPPIIYITNLGIPYGSAGFTNFRDLKIRIRPGQLNRLAKHEMLHYIMAFNGDISDSTHGNGSFRHDPVFNRCGLVLR